MKNLFVKLFFAFLFLLPVSCFADMLCSSHSNSVYSYRIDNITAFPDYDFFYITRYDTTIALPGKDCSYTAFHPEEVSFFARDKKTGASTSQGYIQCWADKQTIITIEKIENDSIYFKTNHEEIKSSAFHNSPVSPITKLLLLISFCGLFIYCCTLFYRKPILKEN